MQVRMPFRRRKAVAEKANGKKTPIVLNPRVRFNLKTLLAHNVLLTGIHGVVRFYQIKVGNRYIRSMALKSPRAGRPKSEVLKDFDILNSLRNNPAIREYVPRTIRLIREGEHYSILLTDLTRNGRYRVVSDIEASNCRNHQDIDKEIEYLKDLLIQNGYTPHGDEFLVQIDPELNWAKKVWIVDVGGLRRKNQI